MKSGVIRSGNTRAALLAKALRLTADQVEISSESNDIVLRERPASAVAVFDALVIMPVDFLTGGRGDSPPQIREAF
ncbi:hypothetical protein GCM10023165_09490 [Variovorax defluvii]|uniref:Uncharacterized protein n=1 Tax=Variovorax defluvii TaxID=913761 RepID=A0ABP8H3U6_9BURK